MEVGLISMHDDVVKLTASAMVIALQA